MAGAWPVPTIDTASPGTASPTLAEPPIYISIDHLENHKAINISITAYPPSVLESDPSPPIDYNESLDGLLGAWANFWS